MSEKITTMKESADIGASMPPAAREELLMLLASLAEKQGRLNIDGIDVAEVAQGAMFLISDFAQRLADARGEVAQMREALESVQAVSDTWYPQLADTRVKVDAALRAVKEAGE